MSSDYILNLQDRVRRGLETAKNALESKERYTRSAFSSGGGEEARYKSMRNEESARRDRAMEDADAAMQELYQNGIETQVMPDHITVKFSRR